MMTAVATAMSAATRYSAPMPLSISRREPRRAPMTELTAAYAHMTNEDRRRNVPRLAIAYVLRSGRCAAAGCFVFRWTLRDHAVGIGVEAAVRGELAPEHHFGFAFERVGHDACIADGHHVAGLARSDRVVLHAKPVLKRIGLRGDRTWNDVAVHLQLLAFELRPL